MKLFNKDETPREKIRRSVLNRLRNVTSGEVMRWADNIVTSLGQCMHETQKSLSHSDSTQALMHLEDMRTNAVSLLAAIQVMEERINQQA